MNKVTLFRFYVMKCLMLDTTFEAYIVNWNKLIFLRTDPISTIKATIFNGLRK